MDNFSNCISVTEAAILLKVKPSTVRHRIESGVLSATTPDDKPFTSDGLVNYLISLDSLPQRLQYKYLFSHLSPEQKCSADLVSPRSSLGNIWLDEFLDISSIIREATDIRKENHSNGQITNLMKQLAIKHRISLATLYRLLGKPTAVEVSSLYIDPFYLQNHLPKTMCLWSCDLVFALYLDSNKRYSQNDIIAELEKKRSIVKCQDCPYHSTSNDVPQCTKAEEFMIIPNHRKTINRLLAHIPSQMTLYARRGYREWRSTYGLFVVRHRPLFVNENWQGDHHKFDLFVRVTIHRESGGKIYEKEIALRPTLTAWMDSATGCIVGWVISAVPSSDTIAEAFCRASVLKPGSPMHGLPLSVLVDCGKDYKSRLLEDFPLSLSIEDTMLNKRFAGLGILNSLGVKCVHALPYHPQSKPIERCFKTIEEKWITKLPGWCRNSISERPDNFQKQIDFMLKEKQLLTLEEFSEYFQGTILPQYHNEADTETEIPKLPGWQLSLTSMSPIQRYNFLEKVKTKTPDWPTISILKMHHSPNHKVGRWGIRFSNTYYQADELSDKVGESVSILFNKVQPPYAPSSITIIYNSSFLCEAFPAEIRNLIGDSKTDIMCDCDRQNLPANKIKSGLSRIRQSVNAILPDSVKSFSNEKSQLYDQLYSTSVEAETSINSTIKTSLSLLFGEE